jgi:hypothetical protein
MGARAAFWMGDPINLDRREWLGCIAWDGYPDAFEDLASCNEAGFRAAVMRMAANRKDFAAPAGGWPFPWSDDIFLTDYTYAFFDDAVQVCCFHDPFMPMAQYLARDDDADELTDDPRHVKVPAPAEYNPEQPDSIVILSFR